jgi:hypothetical protein
MLINSLIRLDEWIKVYNDNNIIDAKRYALISNSP